MSQPKFQDGQTVRVIQSKRVVKASGDFRIGRVLPQLNGINQYLIRSTTDGQQRVVSEYELA